MLRKIREGKAVVEDWFVVGEVDHDGRDVVSDGLVDGQVVIREL